MASPISPTLDHRVLANGLDHVEGVCWDPIRQCLWAGGEAGQLYQIELSGSYEVFTTIKNGALLGIALDASGNLYVCDPGNHHVWRVFDDATYEPYGDHIGYPNYAAFASDGHLYVSDSGAVESPTGQVFVIAPSGKTTRLALRPLGYANGLCVDDEYLWIVESSVPCVSRWPLAGGSLEVVIAMERCTPDGLARDADGGLLVSCYQPNQLWHWTKEKGLSLVFEDWTGEYILSPTNTAFYGDKLDRLALASLCGDRVNTIRLAQSGGRIFYPSTESGPA
jgi:sugar lactone lactonase YvrE